MPEELICPSCNLSLQKEKNHYQCLHCQISYPIKHNIPCFLTQNQQTSGFDPKLFKLLFEIEKKHFWHIGRKEIIYQILRKIMTKDFKDLKMIELGCGNGNVLKYLHQQGINIEGSDLFLEALKFCQQIINVPLYQINALRTPFRDASYDIIGLFDLLEHIKNDAELLKEAYRICKPQGKIILTVPAHQHLWSYFDVLSHHQRRYCKKELVNKLEKAGFQIEKISFYMFFLFPIYWAFRKINLFRKSNKNLLASQLLELKPIPLLNKCFLSLLRLEKKLITRVNLPWGASLICVAQKQLKNES